MRERGFLIRGLLVELVVHEGESILVFQGTFHVLLIMLDLKRSLLVYVYYIRCTSIVKEDLTCAAFGLPHSVLSGLALDRGTRGLGRFSISDVLLLLFDQLPRGIIRVQV